MSRILSSLPALLLLNACGAENTLLEDAFNWDVTVTGIEDSCNANMVSYSEKFTYSLVFEGSSTSLYIGDSPFAGGVIKGCSLDYEGAVIGEERGSQDEYWIQWQLSGECQLRQGGSACDLEVGKDWIGAETFTILQSTDPSLKEDCAYTMSVEGKFTGQNG
jgi:hypothetical protein